MKPQTQIQIQKELFRHGEEAYRSFQCKLMPTVNPDTVIGVRIPILRRMAQRLAKSDEATAFTSTLPHRYYEENNLHAFLIERIGDYDACVRALDDFLPFVDNWATCDSMNPRVLGKHKKQLLCDIERWLASPYPFEIRFAVKLLMTHFLDEDFDPAYPARISRIASEEYYVNMMISWYFATALAKKYREILPYLVDRTLSPWIHKKTIQKAIESDRITKEQKEELKALR